MADTTAPTTSSPPQNTPQISLRPPSHAPSDPTSAQQQPVATYVPPVSFIEGTWHVTHSSLPMWRKSQNVSIKYTVLSLDSAGRPTFDNLVEYQALGAAPNATKKTIKGVEAPREGLEGAWQWRGKGWLKIASSDWEVLGYGRSSSDGGRRNDVGNEGAAATGQGQEMERKEDDWCVTYFAKTMFTPSGIDVYCRGSAGLDEAVLGKIKEALKTCGEEVQKLGEELFEVKRTGL